MCPAAEVALYSHRNPGEDMHQAVSTGGRQLHRVADRVRLSQGLQSVVQLPAAGQTWADALKHLDDQTVERGDIVVTEERAQALSQPADQRGKGPAAKGKGAQPKEAPPQAPKASAPPKQNGEGKPKVRTVGPPFIPSN